MSVPLLEIHACTVHSRALSIAEFTALAAPTNKSSGLNCSPTLTLTTAVHTWFFIIYLFTGISTIFRPSPRCNIITYSYLYVYLFLHSCAIHILYLKAMLPLFTFYLCPPMWMHTLYQPTSYSPFVISPLNTLQVISVNLLAWISLH